MRVKKTGLKLNIQKIKIMEYDPGPVCYLFYIYSVYMLIPMSSFNIVLVLRL